MQEAAKEKRGNAAFIEILIACLVFMVSSIAMGVIQLPAFMVYLFGDEEYMRLMMSGDGVSVTQAMEKALHLPDWLVILSLISEILMIIVVILYCRLLEKRKAFTMGFHKKAMFRQYLLGAMGAILIFSGAYVICVLSGSIHFEGLAENMVPAYIIAYLFGYMVQGMAEEVLCRGYLFVSLSRRYPVMYSAVVSSIFFALLHGMNAGLTFLALINLFLYAMFAAFLFMKYENIWIVGAFHSLWNFVQGNFYGIQVSGTDVQNSIFSSSIREDMSFLNGGAFGMEGGLGVSIVLIIAITLILRSMEWEDVSVDVQGVDIQSPDMQYMDYTYPPMQEEAEEMNSIEQSLAEQNSKAPEKGLRENMGVRPDETPWRPDNASWHRNPESPQSESETTFDADYFKD